MSRVTLIAVLDPRWVPRLKAIKGISVPGTIPLFFSHSFDTAAAIRETGPGCNTVNYYMEQEDFSGVNDTAIEYSKRWFMVKGRDISIYNGYSLGHITQKHMGLIFNKAIEIERVVRNILKREDIAKVVILSSVSERRLGFNNMLTSCESFFYSRILSELSRIKDIPVDKRMLCPRFSGRAVKRFKSAFKNIIFSGLNILNGILNTAKKTFFRDFDKVIACHSFHYFGKRLKSMILRNKDYGVLIIRKNFLLREFLFRPNVFQHVVSSGICRGWLEKKRLKKLFSERFSALKDDDLDLPLRGDMEPFKIFGDILRGYFEVKFADITSDIERIEAIFKRYPVSVAALSNDVEEFESCLAVTAKRLNIRTIVLQHGCMNHPLAYLPLKSDMIAVWGEYSKQWLINHGCEESKIRVIGSPRYDSYKSSAFDREAVKKKVFEDFGIAAGKRLFLYAAQAVYDITLTEFYLRKEELAETFLRLCRYVHKRKDCLLILKLKGRSGAGFYKKLLRDNLNGNVHNIRIVTDYNIYDLVTAADILFTVASAVGIEAMLMGAPIITLDFFKRNPAPFSEYGAAISVKRKEDIGLAADTVLNDKDKLQALHAASKRLLERYLFAMDGNASERAFELMQKVA